MLTQEAEVSELASNGIKRIVPVKDGYEAGTLGSATLGWDISNPVVLTVDVARKPDGLVTMRSLRTALMALQALSGGEYVLELEDFLSREVNAKQFIALAKEILDDRFVVVSTDQEKLPWKGKERCMKCGYRVEDWSAKKRICDGCRGSLKMTNRVHGGTWRKGTFQVGD